MVLETCNISLTMDVKEAENSFNELKLSDYSAENVSALATDALKLIKIMNGSYALDVCIGSNLLKRYHLHHQIISIVRFLVILIKHIIWRINTC